MTEVDFFDECTSKLSPYNDDNLHVTPKMKENSYLLHIESLDNDERDENFKTLYQHWDQVLFLFVSLFGKCLRRAYFIFLNMSRLK